MVIPIHDENPVRRTPWVTYLLIALNFAVFLAEPVARAPLLGSPTAAQVCTQRDFFDRYAAIPKEVTTNEPLAPHRYLVDTTQGRVACPVTDESGKQPWLSVLFAMFLHGGWLHLLGNMLFLWVFGNNVEDRMGRLRFLGFYLLCGYVATYVFAFAQPSSTTTLVGASGAIAGVLGAYLVMFPRARVTSLVPFLFFLPFRLPAWLVLGSWFLLQWMYASGTAVAQGAGVAYLAHVAGFVAGLLLALPLAGRRRPPREPAYVWDAPRY
jgi:membrane associated rhomboid family serine protease